MLQCIEGLWVIIRWWVCLSALFDTEVFAFYQYSIYSVVFTLQVSPWQFVKHIVARQLFPMTLMNCIIARQPFSLTLISHIIARQPFHRTDSSSVVSYTTVAMSVKDGAPSLTFPFFAPPQLGSPQQKPKLVRLLCDVSGSMYRFDGYDGRMQREMEAMLMVMEAFENYEQKIKARHSLTSPVVAESVAMCETLGCYHQLYFSCHSMRSLDTLEKGTSLTWWRLRSRPRTTRSGSTH